MFTSHSFPYREIFCLASVFYWSDDLHDIRCFDCLIGIAAKLYLPRLTDSWPRFFLFLSSNVLAAYASFLWETEENEEDSTSQFQIPNHHEGAAAAANA